MSNQTPNSSNSTPSRYRRAGLVRKLTDLEVGYLAGFIDGRGCVTCNVVGKKRDRLLWRIRISSNDKPQIKHIHDLIGLGRLDGYNSKESKRAVLTVGIMEGTNLAAVILPRLMIKWKQFASVMSYVDHAISGVQVDPVGVAELVSNLNQNPAGRVVQWETPEVAAGYISGLWDANGSVCVVRGRPITSIYNTVKEPLLAIRAMLGGQLIAPKKKLAKYSQLYVLRWSSWANLEIFYNMLFSDSKKAKKLYRLHLGHTEFSRRSAEQNLGHRIEPLRSKFFPEPSS